MTSKSIEVTIEEIIASCEGDTHGALKALLLVNEHLETELKNLYTLAVCGLPGRARIKSTMH